MIIAFNKHNYSLCFFFLSFHSLFPVFSFRFRWAAVAAVASVQSARSGPFTINTWCRDEHGAHSTPNTVDKQLTAGQSLLRSSVTLKCAIGMPRTKRGKPLPSPSIFALYANKTLKLDWQIAQRDCETQKIKFGIHFHMRTWKYTVFWLKWTSRSNYSGVKCKKRGAGLSSITNLKALWALPQNWVALALIVSEI